MEERIIAVYGGGFNQPLNSHFSIAQAIINERQDIEKVIFLPVNSKYEKSGLLENEHRFNMLKLVCDKNEKFEVSRIEIEQERQLYTFETLKLLEKEYGGKKIAFVMGTDNLKELPDWILGKELVENFKILVIERDKDIAQTIINENEFLKKYENNFIKVKDEIRTNMSSTYVREKIKKGKCVSYLMPYEVYDYIKANKLYK